MNSFEALLWTKPQVLEDPGSRVVNELVIQSPSKIDVLIYSADRPVSCFSWGLYLCCCTIVASIVDLAAFNHLIKMSYSLPCAPACSTACRPPVASFLPRQAFQPLRVSKVNALILQGQQGLRRSSPRARTSQITRVRQGA